MSFWRDGFRIRWARRPGGTDTCSSSLHRYLTTGHLESKKPGWGGCRGNTYLSHFFLYTLLLYPCLPHRWRCWDFTSPLSFISPGTSHLKVEDCSRSVRERERERERERQHLLEPFNCPLQWDSLMPCRSKVLKISWGQFHEQKVGSKNSPRRNFS